MQQWSVVLGLVSFFYLKASEWRDVTRWAKNFPDSHAPFAFGESNQFPHRRCRMHLPTEVAALFEDHESNFCERTSPEGENTLKKGR